MRIDIQKRRHQLAQRFFLSWSASNTTLLRLSASSSVVTSYGSNQLEG